MELDITLACVEGVEFFPSQSPDAPASVLCDSLLRR